MIIIADYWSRSTGTCRPAEGCSSSTNSQSVRPAGERDSSRETCSRLSRDTTTHSSDSAEEERCDTVGDFFDSRIVKLCGNVDRTRRAGTAHYGNVLEIYLSVILSVRPVKQWILILFCWHCLLPPGMSQKTKKSCQAHPHISGIDIRLASACLCFPNQHWYSFKPKFHCFDFNESYNKLCNILACQHVVGLW